MFFRVNNKYTNIVVHVCLYRHKHFTVANLREYRLIQSDMKKIKSIWNTGIKMYT